MEIKNQNELYEIRMAEIEKLKNIIERNIKLSKSNVFSGNLIEKKRKSDELKKIICEIRKHSTEYWWQKIYN